MLWNTTAWNDYSRGEFVHYRQLVEETTCALHGSEEVWLRLPLWRSLALLVRQMHSIITVAAADLVLALSAVSRQAR
jgi:hypothetical protein